VTCTLNALALHSRYSIVAVIEGAETLLRFLAASNGTRLGAYANSYEFECMVIVWYAIVEVVLKIG